MNLTSDIIIVIVGSVVGILGSFILGMLWKLLKKTDVVVENIADIKEALHINGLKTNLIGNYIANKDKDFTLLWYSVHDKNSPSSMKTTLEQTNNSLESQVCITHSSKENDRKVNGPKSPL